MLIPSAQKYFYLGIKFQTDVTHQINNMKTGISSIMTILYVKDQQKSTEFYRQVLNRSAILDVPGMTEFQILNNCKLGLMPNEGIAKIIQNKLPDPSLGDGIPRCELYLQVENVNKAINHAIACGARLISHPAARDWGDTVGYLADPDGHVIAFACKTV